MSGKTVKFKKMVVQAENFEKVIELEKMTAKIVKFEKIEAKKVKLKKQWRQKWLNFLKQGKLKSH